MLMFREKTKDHRDKEIFNSDASMNSLIGSYFHDSIVLEG